MIFLMFQYQFLNLSRSNCVAEATYDKCYINCMRKLYERYLPCKMPFLNAETGNCTIQNMLLATRVAMELSFITLPKDDCGCTRKCEQTTYDLHIQLLIPYLPNITAFVIGCSSPFVTSTKERLAYDFLSLLCDIGGNLGLFSGLSLLTIFETFFIMQQVLRKRRERQKTIIFSKSDPIARKIRKIMKESTKKTDGVISLSDYLPDPEIFLHPQKLIFTIIRISVNVINILFFSYLIVNRIMFYYTYPVEVNLEVQENSSVTFPDIILCHYGVSIAADKEKKMKSLRKNQCDDISLIDLLDAKPHATKLWKASDFGKMLPLIGVGSKAGNDSLMPAGIGIQNVTKKSINTPLGKCTKYSPGAIKYYGSTTAFMSLYICDHRPAYLCNDNTFKFYIIAPGYVPDWLSLDEMITCSCSINTIVIKQVQHLSTPIKPCVDAAEENGCKKYCKQKLLKGNLKCKLPYMKVPREDNLTECNSTNDAREAQHFYFRVQEQVYSSSFCRCAKRCIENIYEIKVFNVDFPRQLSTIQFAFLHNMIEKIVYVDSYPFVKLLCDIGGNLGLAVGACVLSIIDNAFRLSIKIKKIVTK